MKFNEMENLSVIQNVQENLWFEGLGWDDMRWDELEDIL